jgi:hypothetical protein
MKVVLKRVVTCSVENVAGRGALDNEGRVFGDI